MPAGPVWMVTSVLPSISLTNCFDFVDGLGEAHAALFTGGGFLELALAAAARMNLRLDDPERTAQFLGGGFGFLDLEYRNAARNGHSEFLENGFRLIFVNIHMTSSWMNETDLDQARAGLICLQASIRP